MLTEKLCKYCSTTKPLEEFSRQKGGLGGRRSICKICDKAKQAVHREAFKEQKAVYDKKRWELNKKRLSENHKRWRLSNKQIRNASILNRHYKKKAAGGFVPNNIRELLFQTQKGLCFYCFEPLSDYHLEHQTPLIRGGLHDVSNLCLACPSCNLQKGRKTADEFAKRAE